MLPGDAIWHKTQVGSRPDVTCATVVRCGFVALAYWIGSGYDHHDLCTTQEYALTSHVWWLFFTSSGTIRLPWAYMMHHRKVVSLASFPCDPARLADYKRLLTAAITEPLPRAYIMHKDPHRSCPGKKLGQRRVNEAINRCDYFQKYSRLHCR
jgi:hypothetical protein